jgi:hypothetical protein
MLQVQRPKLQLVDGRQVPFHRLRRPRGAVSAEIAPSGLTASYCEDLRDLARALGRVWATLWNED